jgi:phosphoglycerol transferase MdoB-like AlkP superfamily enzyme
MGTWTIRALRIIIALSLAGSLVVQTLIVPALWNDLDGAPSWARIAIVILVVLGVLTMQVFAVCVWQLLTLVRRGAVFSQAAFRYVHVIIAAVAAASVVTFAFAVVLRFGRAAPGVVGLVSGFALVLAGMALLVVVMRTLLTQAIDREAEAGKLRAELDEVI